MRYTNHGMRAFIRVFALALLSAQIAMLVACGTPRVERKPVAATAAPKPPAPPRKRYVQRPPPPLYYPRPFTGMRTVYDILRDYGPEATTRLAPYFQRAGVAYPPSEVILLGLKAERKLELWARDHGHHKFIRSYDIHAASGFRGPKLREGDRQVPEGIYRVVGLNPNSNYHLSMKLDYPNRFDLLHAFEEGRTHPGGDIFIHGKARSIGCLAMGDITIEELFVLVGQIGEEHVKVVIAPHDPRTKPLLPPPPGLPDWVPDLYRDIVVEVGQLQPARAQSAAAVQRRR